MPPRSMSHEERQAHVTALAASKGSLLSPNGKVALAYAAAGFFVFPCSAKRKPHKPEDRLSFGKAEKTPLVKSWSAEATKDEATIREWWTRNPEALVALPCKQNRLFVIDCDRHTAEDDGVAAFAALCEDREMPPHPVIQTDFEGEHHIFLMPDEPIGHGKSKLPPGVETRGYQRDNDGGYIIASGSRMPDGRGWKRMQGTPRLNEQLPLPPQWLIEICRPPQKSAPAPVIQLRPSGKNEEAYATSALNRVASILAAEREGGRDNLLMSVAGTMGRMMKAGWIGQATIEGRLLDACQTNGLLKEIGEAEVRDKIRRSVDAVTPHEPLPERPLQPKANGSAAIKPEIENKTPAHSWDDPDWSILDDRRGELPEFPIDVFSEKMQELIKRTSRGAGVTHAHVAVPLLGIASGIIGYARRVKATSSWYSPMTCWAAVIGYSGTGKTPGLNVTRRVLKKVESLGKAKEDKRKRDHETKKAAAKAARDKWETEVADAIEAGLTAPDMPVAAVDPGKYVAMRLSVADGTIERLAELLQARPHGIILVRDELAALFMNMSRYNGGQDDEFWLECWNGESYPVERMNRTLLVDHLLIGMVGGMQPDKLVKSFEGDHDGKYARVLFAWPPEPKWAGLSNDAAEIDVDIQNIISLLDGLAQFTEDGKLVQLAIPLDAEAYDEFERFSQLAQQDREGYEGREREWYAKANAHALRLAGTITYIEWAINLNPEKPAKPEAVSKQTMTAAIRLVRDYFWPHARACLRQIGLTERHANARRTLKWLRVNRRAEVSREDIRRDALSQRLDADQTTELLAALCGYGWMKEGVTPPGPQGGKPAKRWLVNPKLYSDPTAETAETAETS